MHKILDEDIEDGDGWIKKTTHPKVVYNALSEEYLVVVDDRTWCEVFGAGRAKLAYQIGDMLLKEGE